MSDYHPESSDFPRPDRERFCVHDGHFCPYSPTCIYNDTTGECRMQVCEVAIASGLMKCGQCKSRPRCEEVWTCFRRQRWIRKRATREARP